MLKPNQVDLQLLNLIVVVVVVSKLVSHFTFFSQKNEKILVMKKIGLNKIKIKYCDCLTNCRETELAGQGRSSMPRSARSC